MKRLMLCAAIALIMFSAAVSNAFRTERVTGETISELKMISGLFSDGYTRQAAELAEETLKSWESFCADSIFLTDRERALEISLALIRINAMLYAGDDDVSEECAAAAILTGEYRDNQRPLPKNLF